MSESATDPRTLDDVVRALARVRDQSRAYWQGFTPDAFLSPLGDAWSPADNVRHLTKSVRPVAMALKLPRLLLRLRFGRPKAASRTYAALVEEYRGRLAAGGQAGGYAPRALEPQPDAAAARTRILAQHDEAVDALIAACGRWKDAALDRYQLPHPLLGDLTLREILFFTVYHNQHHVAVVRRRVAEATVPIESG